MSNYPAPPPAYDARQNKSYSSNDEAARPLLSPQSGTSRNAIFDQPTDLPDDFKVRWNAFTLVGRLFVDVESTVWSERVRELT